MNKGGRSKVIVYAMIALALVIFVDHIWGGKRAYNMTIKKLVDSEVAVVTQRYHDELERLRAQLNEKETALRASEQRYAHLKALIKAKASEAGNIKPSGDRNEIRARFERRGFPTVE